MANGGLSFLLLPFQYLVGWEIFNLVISVNLFRFVYIENYQRRSPAVRDPRFDSWSNRDLLAPCC
jgi:hypothetical protein